MNEYAEAVNEADAQLGSQVWCGSEEDSLTNQAGRWQGAQQIKALCALLKESYSEPKLTFDTVSIHSYGDFAWTEFRGDFTANFGGVASAPPSESSFTCASLPDRTPSSVASTVSPMPSGRISRWTAMRICPFFFMPSRLDLAHRPGKSASYTQT